MTFRTGFAARLGGVGDTTGTGTSSRPTMVAGQSPNLDRGDRTARRWFNTDAFSVTPNGQFGNAVRHPIYLPGFNNVDFSAVKNFSVTEQHKLQLRFEFFNFFNHVNFGAPGTNVNTPATFGVITTANQGSAGVPNDARIIQFGVKYSF